MFPAHTVSCSVSTRGQRSNTLNKMEEASKQRKIQAAEIGIVKVDERLREAAIKIKALEGDIQSVVERLEKKESEHPRDDGAIAALRDREKRLREEKGQLGEEKLRLMKKEEQLRDERNKLQQGLPLGEIPAANTLLVSSIILYWTFAPGFNVLTVYLFLASPSFHGVLLLDCIAGAMKVLGMQSFVVFLSYHRSLRCAVKFVLWFCYCFNSFGP